MTSLEITFLASAVVTLASGLIILMSNPWRMINRCYPLASVISALWLFCIFMAIHLGQNPYAGGRQEILFWVRMTNAVAAFLPWTYFLIKECIIEANPSSGLFRRSLPWLFVSGLLALLAFSESFLSSNSSSAVGHRGTGYTIYLTSLAIPCLWVLYEAFKAHRKSHGISKMELRFFSINFSLATLVVVLMFFVSSALQIQFLRYMGPPVVVLSFGLTIGAVFYYRIFDAKQILLAVTQRIFLLGLLGGCATCLATMFESVIPPAYGIFLASVLACFLAIYLDRPTKKWMGLDPANRLRGARQTIIDWTRRESDEERLRSHFGRFLAHWCQTGNVVLLANQSGQFVTPELSLPSNWTGLEFVSKEGWITPEALLRQKRTPGSEACLDFLSRYRLGALLAVPRGSSPPSLLIAFDRKPSLRPYTYPDIQMLLDLAELMDNILTHSRAAARTAQIEKMESAAMMSRGLAHDLNNLATPVSSFLLHMESRVSAGTAEAEVLADAKHSIRVMQDYIRESLFFARRLVPDFQPVSSAELLAATIRVTQARAQIRGVDVVQGKTADLTFKADRALIQRLLQNLVFNGIDATPRGGQVTLSAATDDQDRICFSVSDQGSGVPTGIMNHIFEPYFTTKDTGNEVRGLGLGLAISKKISDLHLGTLGVGRSPSGGAIFTVSLPTNPKRPAPASLTPAPSESVLAAAPDTGNLLPR